MLCGDIFDVVNPPPSVIREYRMLMDMCQSVGMPVYYYQGNHDKRPTPWPMALHDHPTYVGDGKPFQIGALRCVALDYLGRDRIEAAIVEMNNDPPDVLFLHQAVRQALRFENAWNCDLDWVSPRVKTIVLGDIHQPLTMTCPGGKAYYTGASSPRNIDELSPKSFLILNQDHSVERVPLPSRPMQRVTLSETTPLEILSWAGKALLDAYQLDPVGRLHPVLFIRYTAQETAIAQKLRDDLQSLAQGRTFKVVLQALDDTSYQPEQSADRTGKTFEELLNGRVDPATQPQTHNLVLDLWQSPEDPIDIIAAHRKAFYDGRR
jgi:DNA repair exonuclease SbcCD nuclease subunit